MISFNEALNNYYEFKTLYDYKLYISTDDINLHDTISYFSVNNIGNIHLLNTGFYFIEPKNKTENINIYFDKYEITEPIHFDFNKKHSIQNIDDIKYIKLRLCDSQFWSSILSNIFQFDIVIINDHKTENKIIGNLYNRFKNEYKLPINLFELVKNDKYFNFYYNEIERNEYLNNWNNKLCEEVIPYTHSEFIFYINLC